MICFEDCNRLMCGTGLGTGDWTGKRTEASPGQRGLYTLHFTLISLQFTLIWDLRVWTKRFLSPKAGAAQDYLSVNHLSPTFYTKVNVAKYIWMNMPRMTISTECLALKFKEAWLWWAGRPRLKRAGHLSRMRWYEQGEITQTTPRWTLEATMRNVYIIFIRHNDSS